MCAHHNIEIVRRSDERKSKQSQGETEEDFLGINERNDGGGGKV